MKLLFENWRRYLNEIGEGTLEPYPYQLVSGDEEGEVVIYAFKSEIKGGGSDYNVIFSRYETDGKDYWDISFETEFYGTGETDEGQPLKILSTVVEIVKDFNSKPDLNKNIRTYAFAGLPKLGEDFYGGQKTTRTRIYTRFLKNNGAKIIKDLGNHIWFTLPGPPKPPDEPVDPEYLERLGKLF